MSAERNLKEKEEGPKAKEFDSRDLDLNELRTPDGKEISLSHTNSEEFQRLKKVTPSLSSLSMTEAQYVSLNSLNVPEEKQASPENLSKIEELHFKPVELNSSYEVYSYQPSSKAQGNGPLEEFIDSIIGLIVSFLTLGLSGKKESKSKNNNRYRLSRRY